MISVQKGLTFSDILLIPGYNGIRSREEVTTEVVIGPLRLSIPLISSNMDTITEETMANEMASLGGMGILHRFMSIDTNVSVFKKLKYPEKTAISLGIGTKEMDRAHELHHHGARIFCVDVAHGHSKEVNRTIRGLREQYKDSILIIAGNVATYAGADYLASAGADIIKVGIGSGSVCSTRMKAGFGVPQITALLDCKKVDRPLISDGGIVYPSDVVKAIALGADMVMLGGLLSGTDETPGPLLEKKDDKGAVITYKKFRGMASKEAQEEYMGGMPEWKTAEGISLEVPSRGPVRHIIQDIVGGLRSGMTYCGASTLKALQRKATFVEISPSAYQEGLPHGKDWLSL